MICGSVNLIFFIGISSINATRKFYVWPPDVALVPNNATPELQRMAKDWAEYSTACRGGAVDGNQETALGYCGTASYLDYRLQETGLCYESAARAFTPCDPKTAKNPLEGYAF